MKTEEILQLARSYPDLAQAMHHDIVPESVLIAFANAIRNAALEEAAGIAEDWDSDAADPREVAAAIREAKS